MLTHTDLKKGVKIILEKEPYEILESQLSKIAKGRSNVQTKIKNLITGSVFSKNFHQGDTFEEAEVLKFNAIFLYAHRGQFFFSQEQDPSQRFSLAENKIGVQAKFLKPNQIVEAMTFEEKIINFSLPIKIKLKVIEAPPGFRGERAQPGTKIVILETGAKISTPLFLEEGDIVEVNTETGEYVRRV